MTFKVVLVDSDEQRRVKSLLVLSQRGLDVVALATPREALDDLARAAVPSGVVICSAAAAGARELILDLSRRWPALPVLVAAAPADRKLALAAFSAGALGMIEAPIDGDEVDAWLARLADTEARALNAARNAEVAKENGELMQQLTASGRLASLGQLAAAIAHEIRNPLGWVLENARYVSEKLDQCEAQPSGLLLTELREAARDVASGATRIRDLVRDVGTVASPDETTLVRFDVGDAVRAALRIASAELRGRAEVVTRLGADTKVMGSIGRMTQVFVNLLVNAAHALGAESSRRGRIVVVCRRTGDRVFAEVADNGPGIAPEHLERLFEAFFTTKREGEGTGLGLFLSRDIVRRHGGELRVRSMPGRGTTFSLDLPADVSGEARTEGAGVAQPGIAVGASPDGSVDA